VIEGNLSCFNVSVRPQPAAVAAASALAGTSGETSSDEFLVEQIAAGSKPAMQTLSPGIGPTSTAGYFGSSAIGAGSRPVWQTTMAPLVVTGEGLSVHGAAAERRGSINNTTGPAVTRPGRVTAFAETRRSNDTKAAGRHLSPRSGDAGQDAGPVDLISTFRVEPSPVDPTDRFRRPTGTLAGSGGRSTGQLRAESADPLGDRSLVRARIRVVVDYSAKPGCRRDVADGVDLFTVPPTSRSKPCQRRHDAANTQRAP
jgi:hypothetical protein